MVWLSSSDQSQAALPDMCVISGRVSSSAARASRPSQQLLAHQRRPAAGLLARVVHLAEQHLGLVEASRELVGAGLLLDGEEPGREVPEPCGLGGQGVGLLQAALELARHQPLPGPVGQGHA